VASVSGSGSSSLRTGSQIGAACGCMFPPVGKNTQDAVPGLKTQPPNAAKVKSRSPALGSPNNFADLGLCVIPGNTQIQKSADELLVGYVFHVQI
jgi:hypothetical protein